MIKILFGNHPIEVEVRIPVKNKPLFNIALQSSLIDIDLYKLVQCTLFRIAWIGDYFALSVVLSF